MNVKEKSEVREVTSGEITRDEITSRELDAVNGGTDSCAIRLEGCSDYVLVVNSNISNLADVPIASLFARGR